MQHEPPKMHLMLSFHRAGHSYSQVQRTCVRGNEGRMIHYHGSPLTPDHAAVVVYQAKHAMVSHYRPEQLPLVADVCQSFALDNGAFSAWRAGKPIKDWEPFYVWVEQWLRHPGFDWFLIPDVIDGDEAQNDELLDAATNREWAVPIWHLHESLNRLDRLSVEWKRVALGSSGIYAEIGTDLWWKRMSDAMSVVCDQQGRPRCKLHGLRMLDPRIFSRFPFSSADSTNAARNVGLDVRWRGPYEPVNKAGRGVVIVSRIEAEQSAHVWTPGYQQDELFDGVCLDPEVA